MTDITTPGRRGSKALVCLTLEGKKTVRVTKVRKENTVQATEGMEKMATNAIVKMVATSC